MNNVDIKKLEKNIELVMTQPYLYSFNQIKTILLLTAKMWSLKGK